MAINTAYRGPLLAHVIENSDARLIVTHAGLVLRLAEVATAKLERALVVGGPVDCALETSDFAASVAAAGEPRDPERTIRPWDMQSIVYTSGTTGPSKGVMSSYFHAWNGMNETAWPCLRRDDRMMINMPLFSCCRDTCASRMSCRKRRPRRCRKPSYGGPAITPDTWDREAAGIKIRAERLTP